MRRSKERRGLPFVSITSALFVFFVPFSEPLCIVHSRFEAAVRWRRHHLKTYIIFVLRRWYVGRRAVFGAVYSDDSHAQKPVPFHLFALFLFVCASLSLNVTDQDLLRFRDISKFSSSSEIIPSHFPFFSHQFLYNFYSISGEFHVS